MVIHGTLASAPGIIGNATPGRLLSLGPGRALRYA